MCLLRVKILFFLESPLYPTQERVHPDFFVNLPCNHPLGTFCTLIGDLVQCRNLVFLTILLISHLRVHPDFLVYLPCNHPIGTFCTLQGLIFSVKILVFLQSPLYHTPGQGSSQFFGKFARQSHCWNILHFDSALVKCKNIFFLQSPLYLTYPRAGFIPIFW